MSTASCSDYRAGSTIDLEHGAADITTKVTCPLLALWAEHGIMTTLFDIPAEWRKRCTDVSAATVPGGHFFLDQPPEATARIWRSAVRRVGKGWGGTFRSWWSR